LQIIEQFFDLDEGSLLKAELIYQLFFEKISDTQVAKISNNSNNLWMNSLPNDILQSLFRNKHLVQ